MADEPLETERLGVFLGLAFGLSWATAGVVFVTGGLSGSPTLLPGVTLALVLIAGPYMLAPAVANVVTRLATGEGRRALRLRPNLRATWRFYLLAWLGPVALVIVGATLYFLAVPGSFGGLEAVAATADRAGLPASLSAEAFLGIQVGQLLVIAPLVNGPFAFGEEFGWRGYLLPKLRPLGDRRALVIHGVIWGVWHWPVIAMGHNYGLDYPGAPWAGLLAMVVFTVGVGVVFGWLTLRGGSVWPATIAHAMVNGAGGLGLLFLAGSPQLLLGPTASGLVAMLPWLAVAGWLLWRLERPGRPAA